MVYSFDTNTLQEDALTFKRQQVNADRAAMNPPQPPFETNPDYVAFFIATVIFAPVLVEYVDFRLQKVANAYRVATDDQRKTVDGTLKI